jgi:hypothetical protein
MSVWDWVNEYRMQAEEAGDDDRVRLTLLLDDAWQYKETNLDQAAAILKEGRRQAQELGERKWELFYDHWYLQLRIHYMADFHDILDLAVKATLEASKPQFGDFPQRICLHEDLIYSYVKIDPLGYESLIEQALDYMQREVTPDLECWYCTEGCRMLFETHRENLDAARDAGLRLLAMSAQSGQTHYAEAAFVDLCPIAYRQHDFTTLGEWAQAGEDVSRRLDRKHRVAEFQMWQAVVARHNHDEPTANRFARSAVARMSRLDIPPTEVYFEALTGFHERGENWSDALRVVEAHLETIHGKGQQAREADCQLQRCRLLKKLGQPLGAAMTAAKEAAVKLRKPERVLREIEKISQDR